MMWPPKNLKQALIPIFILNWLWGLEPVKFPVGNSRKNIILIFVLIIVTSLWLANAFFQLNSCASEIAASLDVMVFTMLRYFNTLTASLSLIFGWYSRKRMQLCMQRIELMDEAFESLGIERKYRKIFVKSLIMSIIWLTLMCSVYFADVYLHLSEIGDLIKSMLCILCFQWPIHTNTVVDITFISTLSCLGSRFKKINSLLWESSKRNTLYKIVNKRKRIQIIAKSYNICLSTKNISFIELLKHLHLELSETTKEINEIYETQITMEMATNFVSITAVLYYLRNAFNLTATSSEAQIFNKIALILWGTIYFLKFFHLNIAAEIICAEVRKTRDTVLELKQTKGDNELVEEMEQFTLQLTQNPSLITIHGFKSLGTKFVIQFLGEVTTYLVILMQMRSKY